MNKDLILKSIFGVSFICTVIGIFGKIMHINLGLPFLAIGTGLSIVYTPIVLLEVFTSNKLHISEKIMWLTGFVFLNGLAGLLYFTGGRKRVIQKTVRQFIRPIRLDNNN